MIVTLTTFESHTINKTFKIDHNRIALASFLAGGRFYLGTRSTHLFKTAVENFRVRNKLFFFKRKLGVVFGSNLRFDFYFRLISKGFSLNDTAAINDVGLANHGDCIFLQGLEVSVIDQTRENFLLHLSAIILFENRDRDLAGAKALNLGGFADLLKSLADFFINLVCSNLKAQLLFNAADIFNFNVHALAPHVLYRSHAQKTQRPAYLFSNFILL